MKEVSFTWRIENISYSWHQTGEWIVSPSFCAGPMHKTAWNLSLYPRGNENSDFLSLYLHRGLDNFHMNLAVNFELSCISADKSVLHSSFVPETFKTFATDNGFGESRFIKRYEVFERRKALYLPKDTLTLRCRMWRDEGDTDEFQQIFARTRLVTDEINSVENLNLENEEEKTFHVQSKSQRNALMSISVLYLCDKIDVRINPISKVNMKFCTCKLIFVDKKTGRRLCEHVSCFFGGPQNELWRFPFSDKVLRRRNDNSAESGFEFITQLIYSTGEEKQIIEHDYPCRNSEFISRYILSCGHPTDNSRITHDLWNLYTEQVLCDVKLKTQERSLFAHKIVLCARSPVFLSMLTGDMKEKVNACIEIEDISSDTLDMLLKFLYTDVFKDLEWNEVLDLYYAADKYQVERLKLLCCSYLLENVDVGNVYELLILADRHYDRELKWKVNDFILKNEEKIFRSSMWKKFADDHQPLAMQTMLSKYEEKENHSPAQTYNDRLSSIPKIYDDFRRFFQDRIASDVVIKTEGSTFPAHKTILCASSNKFREMLMNDLRDKSTDSFEMKDWEDDTVSRMLLFLYTGSLEDTQWDIAIQLYQVADAYEIARLQIECSCFLLKNLSVSNAIHLLLLADKHIDVQLQSVVEDYILLHDEEIFGSDEWAKFSKSNLLLANETMRAKYKKNY